MKIYLKYGTMNSSKSAELLMNAHNYKTKGVPVFLLTPSTDTRSGVSTISSRVGIKAKADFVVSEFNDDLKKFIRHAFTEDGVLMLDECQFLDYNTVNQICDYCHYLDHLDKFRPNFALLVYGLLTDFRGKLFDGSRAWVENADSMHEIKTVCHYCSRKATKNYLNAPHNDEGNIIIGDHEFIPVCSYHYYELTHQQQHTNNQGVKMNNLITNLSITMIMGLALIPVVLAIVFIPILRYFAGLLVFYLLLQVVLDGVTEEVKAERQARISNKPKHSKQN